MNYKVLVFVFLSTLSGVSQTMMTKHMFGSFHDGKLSYFYKEKERKEKNESGGLQILPTFELNLKEILNGVLILSSAYIIVKTIR